MSEYAPGGRPLCAFPFLLTTREVVLSLFLFLLFAGPAGAEKRFVLRVRDWKTGEVYASAPAEAGDRLFFGWIHSLEKIPWNEYYHISDDGALVLDAITFPAFGAGIPENKGKISYVKDGLIHMEDIGQRFEELVWLNSRTATRDLFLNWRYFTSGPELPHHVRLRLAVEKNETSP
ncbi:MAG: DUF1850 domain-containing protein [Synergistaceae bacterium]|jgi:hypothetical protein|nr:DUF1850 domain-containing protein [Synergistaceae bacterium]